MMAGAIFVLAGAACVAYVWAGAAAFEREPPFVALGVLLIAVGAGLGGRSRAASLIARGGLAAVLLVIVWRLFSRHLAPTAPDTVDDLIRRFDVLGLAAAAAAVVALLILLGRAPHAPTWRVIDLLPLAGLAAAIALVVVGRGDDDTRLRPCRLGNDRACESLATELLESAEGAPAAPPTAWEKSAARLLDERGCRSPEPHPCAVQLYAIGTVAARAGRPDAARQAFLRACDTERRWCARAMQEKSVPWTPDELERLRPR